MAKLGLQLYTVRDEMQKDFLGTIRRVGAMGYDGVEFAGGSLKAAPPQDIRRVLEETGQVVAGAVFVWNELEQEMPAVIDFCHAVHSPVMVLPGIAQQLRSYEGYQEAARICNAWGRQCLENGLRFLYHVHGYEFVDVGGILAMDLLMEHFEPGIVDLETDVYWVEHAGVDSVAFMQKYGHRTPYIHFKDMADRTTKKDIEVGDGAIDMPAIAKIGYANQAEWFIVEQEQFERPTMESAAISLRNMRKIMQTNHQGV